MGPSVLRPQVSRRLLGLQQALSSPFPAPQVPPTPLSPPYLHSSARPQGGSFFFGCLSPPGSVPSAPLRVPPLLFGSLCVSSTGPHCNPGWPQTQGSPPATAPCCDSSSQHASRGPISSFLDRYSQEL
ncbi:protocadherin-15-like [Fukomys damarensis]|uniref:protocadherin-15-like n=1 Tax=Fukomys damarensis TaxID=885580 RepID=UPI00053F598D|nr:protocadherin-15-like [Fukomys damarensis]